MRPVAVIWVVHRLRRSRKALVMSEYHAPRSRFGSIVAVRVVPLGASFHHARTRVCSAVTGREPVIQPEVGPAPMAPPHRGVAYRTSPVTEPNPLPTPPPTVVPVSSRSVASRHRPLRGAVVIQVPRRSWP